MEPRGGRLAFTDGTPPGGPYASLTWQIADLASGTITPLPQSNGAPVQIAGFPTWSPDGTK